MTSKYQATPRQGGTCNMQCECLAKCYRKCNEIKISTLTDHSKTISQKLYTGKLQIFKIMCKDMQVSREMLVYYTISFSDRAQYMQLVFEKYKALQIQRENMDARKFKRQSIVQVVIILLPFLFLSNLKCFVFFEGQTHNIMLHHFALYKPLCFLFDTFHFFF